MFDADPAKGKEQVHSTVQKLAEHNFNLVLLWVTSDYLVALDDPEYQKKKNRNASWDSLGRSAAPRPLCLVATKEHPVVSAYRHAADRALGGVIVDLQISVLTVAGQRCSVLQCITHRPPLWAFRQDFPLDLE